MPEEYTHVYTAMGQLEGEMTRLFLESKGVRAVAYGESAGKTYGLTVAPMGGVKIYVPASQAEEAERLLADMQAGKFENPDVQPPEDELLDETDDAEGE